jgi:hypothetical protein
VFVFAVVWYEDGTDRIRDVVGLYATRELATQRIRQAETRPGVPNLNYGIEEMEVQGHNAYSPPF